MKLLLTILSLIIVIAVVWQLRRPASEPAAPPQPHAPTATSAPAAPSAPPVSSSTATAETPNIPPKPAPAAAAQPKTFALFNEPVTPAVHELPSGALANWRLHAAHKPALVIFSNHPFLAPLRDEDRSTIRDFVRNALGSELVRRGRLLVADPLLTSPQTVSAAIEAGLISELIFVETTKKTVEQLSLANFQQRAYDADFLTGEEAKALTLKDGVIRGTVRGVPFRCVHPEKLPTLKVPTLVHIDLGYFDKLYVNEVKTPAYPMIYQLMTAIRDAAWPVLEVTLSYSNQEIEFTLEDRFMISTVADVLYRPELLRENIPASWELRANAHYAMEMVAETTGKELVARAADSSPEDPAAQYDLALALLRDRLADEGFAALDRAVALDRGYAPAYVALSDRALELGELETSLALMTKAARALPDQPFIRISVADRLIRLGRTREALVLLHDLRKLPWSPDYHPGVPAQLEEMLKAAGEQGIPRERKLHVGHP